MQHARAVDMSDLAGILAKWATPPAELVSQLPKGGTQLDYMGHAAVTRALIDVDPTWTWEPVTDDRGVPIIEHEGKRFVMWGRLTVLGKTIVCCGTCEDRKFEPEKELIGDLLRNGAMRFGIGLALWAKEEWADLAPPSIFDRIRTADADTKAAVKEYAQSKGYTVTKSALDASQAADLNAWMDRREHPTVDESA